MRSIRIPENNVAPCHLFYRVGNVLECTFTGPYFSWGYSQETFICPAAEAEAARIGVSAVRLADLEPNFALQAEREQGLWPLWTPGAKGKV